MVEERTLPTLIDADASLGETLKVLAAREAHRTSLWDPVSRRRALYRLGAAALVAAPMKAIACSIIPSETAGPYPGDGTNGPNVLTQSGIVRSDIRSSFGSSGTATQDGTPLTVTLQLVNTNSSCAPLAGY